jgi:hypothetical protein
MREMVLGSLLLEEILMIVGALIPLPAQGSEKHKEKAMIIGMIFFGLGGIFLIASLLLLPRVW